MARNGEFVCLYVLAARRFRYQRRLKRKLTLFFVKKNDFRKLATIRIAKTIAIGFFIMLEFLQSCRFPD